MRASLRKAMDLYNGHDLLEEGQFALTVRSDASALDGASTAVVRQYFDDWCVRAVGEEQGSEDEVAARRQHASPYDSRLPLRYRFCIQVDDASLQSVVSGGGKGWVKLISRHWQPREGAGQDRQENEGDITDGEGGDDEEYPAIEGCSEEDVGWMKVQLASVMPDMYVNLRDSRAWNIQYLRPHDVGGVQIEIKHPFTQVAVA